MREARVKAEQLRFQEVELGFEVCSLFGWLAGVVDVGKFYGKPKRE
jgi:hypothetical protein